MTALEQRAANENERRDAFAMAALIGIVACGEAGRYISDAAGVVAREAYDIAEAMMNERKERISK